MLTCLADGEHPCVKTVLTKEDVLVVVDSNYLLQYTAKSAGSAKWVLACGRWDHYADPKYLGVILRPLSVLRIICDYQHDRLVEKVALYLRRCCTDVSEHDNKERFHNRFFQGK
ncbi:hypothetical protein PROFUN_14319 [Planoprotostelium fungivorum]|uniref:Uncharacterized protein n=1 Tax=Planoprotostelium fungivorum TaxID=1890364 RepID=A0A2P6N0J5_9EUKA|nr:hypothetical protein PROFUN_14319 [Planoprotostelium fungivorum]